MKRVKDSLVVVLSLAALILVFSLVIFSTSSEPLSVVNYATRSPSPTPTITPVPTPRRELTVVWVKVIDPYGEAIRRKFAFGRVPKGTNYDGITRSGKPVISVGFYTFEEAKRDILVERYPQECVMVEGYKEENLIVIQRTFNCNFLPIVNRGEDTDLTNTVSEGYPAP